MENCFSVAVPSSTLHSSRWSAGCAFSSEKYFDLVCFFVFFPLSKRNIAENGVIHRSCWDTYQKSDIFHWVVSGESDEQEMSECYFASHEVSGLISAQADVSWAHETLRSPGALFFPAAHEGWWGFWVVFWPLSVPAAWTWPFKDFSSWLCWWSLICPVQSVPCVGICCYLKHVVDTFFGLDRLVCHCWLRCCKSSQLWPLFLNLKSLSRQLPPLMLLHRNCQQYLRMTADDIQILF